jgi:hypothetical protein
MKSFASSVLAIGLAATGSLPAAAADYIATAPAMAPVSVCNEHRVLTHIVNRFGYAEAHLLHNGLAIQDFSRIERTLYVPATEKNPIPRHYCRGLANMNDNRSRPVWYLVEEGMGYAGAFGDNIEFCVAGQDPLRVHGADCNVLKLF